MRKKLLVRADANKKIASGHVKRCLSIANAFPEEEVETVFIVSDVEAEKLLKGTGYRCIVLENDYRKKEQELFLILDIIKKEMADGILVDSYEVTDSYLTQLAEQCAVAYIADTENVNFSGRLLINYIQHTRQQEFEKKYSKIRKAGFLLQGEHYVPLREEFQNVSHRTRNRVEKILITTGGSDADNMCIAVIQECLRQQALSAMRYTVVVGNYFSDVDKLEKLAEACSQVNLKYQVTNMSELMQTHDVAVSAGGTTLFELCACGLPTVSFAMADNQVTMTELFDSKKLIPYAGDERKNKQKVVENIVEQLKYWVEHVEELNDVSDRMSQLVDGKGAVRIAEKMLSMMKNEVLSQAEEQDMYLLFQWANEKKVRQASFCSEPISIEQHKKWFQNVMISNNIHQYIYSINGNPIGQVRITVEDNAAIISYSIAKEYRGKGYGKRMVKLLEREVHDNHPEISELHAYVKSENIASQKVFEGLGFEKCGDMYRKDCK